MAELEQLLNACRSLETNVYQCDRLAKCPEWFRDRILGISHFHAPDESFDVIELVSSEPSWDGRTSDELFVGMLQNTLEKSYLESDYGCGKSRRPPKAGTILVGDCETIRTYQGCGVSHDVFIYFSKKTLIAHFEELLQRPFSSSMLEPLLSNYHFDSELQRLVLAMLKETKNPVASHRVAHSEVLLRAICTRLLHLTGRSSTNLTSTDVLSKTSIQNVIDYLHENYQDELSLRKLSLVAGVSPGHLSRLFKQTIGLSIKAFLLTIRLEKARELLKTSPADVSLNEIANRSGLYDRSQLCREFRRHFGEPPSSFRK